MLSSGEPKTSSPWWDHKITQAQEEITFKHLLKEYTGPRGSLSIPTAHATNYNEQLSALLEAVDPRMRRDKPHFCFRGYYELWRNESPFSGQHFFDWLDYGRDRSGLEEVLEESSEWKKCTKNMFLRHGNQRFHHTNEERLQHEVYIHSSQDGKSLIARFKHDDALVPDCGDYALYGDKESKPYNYMWDLNGILYIAPYNVKHMTMLGGKPALGAGEIYIGTSGVIRGINFDSGHYLPDMKTVSLMYQWMKDNQFNTTAIDWIGRLDQSWRERYCDKIDWKKEFQIPGFDTKALELSCREVTNSPTWVLRDKSH